MELSNGWKLAVFNIVVGMIFFLGQPATAFAKTLVGKVLISRGDVQTTVGRKLRRGADIFQGETIILGAKAAAQLRFTDNQLISLAENTEYRVDNYHFKREDEQNNGAESTLAKGKMMALTGQLIKSNPDKYKVKTKLSTIGVSGTLFTTSLDDSRQLTATAEGSTIIRTKNGVLEIGPGSEFNFAVVSARTLKPIGLIDMPYVIDILLSQQTEGLVEDIFFEQFAVQFFDFSDLSNFADIFNFEDVSNSIILTELPAR